MKIEKCGFKGKVVTETGISGVGGKNGPNARLVARREIEDFVRNIVAEIEAAEAAGAVDDAEAIADHLNANGVTTRKGRSWTGVTVAKFLRSPGAKRYRSRY